MLALEATVQELLGAAQAARKAKLDPGRVDTVFKVGDRVLLRTKELLDDADIGKLRPRWDGPFTVTACPSPNAYTLALPRKMRCSPTVNVDRLKPFFERAGAPAAPGPVSDAGREGEHEVELLLNRRTVRGVTRCLVRWRGHTSADDEVAAAGGAGALPGEGGGVRRRGTAPPRRTPCSPRRQAGGRLSRCSTGQPRAGSAGRSPGVVGPRDSRT
jgi:hypothetical protein